MLQESYILGIKNRQYLIEQAEHNMKILQHAIWHYSRIIDSLLEQKKYEEIKEVFENAIQYVKTFEKKKELLIPEK